MISIVSSLKKQHTKSQHDSSIAITLAPATIMVTAGLYILIQQEYS